MGTSTRVGGRTSEVRPTERTRRMHKPRQSVTCRVKTIRSRHLHSERSVTPSFTSRTRAAAHRRPATETGIRPLAPVTRFTHGSTLAWESLVVHRLRLHLNRLPASRTTQAHVLCFRGEATVLLSATFRS